MRQLKGKPTHKKCRQCGEWFELPAYAKPTQRFCTLSCSAEWRTNTPEFKKAQSERSKAYMQRNAKRMHDAVQALWNDPERREVLVEQARVRSNRKTHLAWMQEHNKRLWKDPEFRKRHSERTTKMLKKRWSDPVEVAKNAARMSKQSKQRWADPVKRQTMSWSNKIAQLAPLTRKKKRELSRARMSTPEAKAKASATLKAMWRDPAYRLRMSKDASTRLRKRWADPAYRARMTKARRSRAEKLRNEGRLK